MERMLPSDEPPASLESVLRTGELARRASGAPQDDALLALAESLAESPRSVLKKLIDTAMRLCNGGSAGICLLEERDGREGFRCYEASGRWASLAGKAMSFHGSPCGIVVERGSTQLFSHPYRHYRELAVLEPLAIQSLHVPFRIGGETVGTAWVVTHETCCSFGADDARVLESLANLGSMAYQVSSSVDALEEQRQALSESEKRFRLMADSSPFIIWVIDSEGRQEFINEAYRSFFGVTTDQVLGRDWEMLIHPDDAHGHRSSLFAAMRAQVPWSYQVRARRADGEWRWLESQAVPRFSGSGEFLGFVGSSPDITEQKLHRERLEALVAERTRELERSHQVQRRTETMAVIGALARGIGHDLGNLLMSFDHHLERLARLELPDRGRRHVEALVSTKSYLDSLNGRLRLYLRGHRSDEFGAEGGGERISLGPWCREVEDFFGTVVPEEISFESDVPATLPPITANKAALTQAVYNLIQNGVQAISEGGGGTVRLTCAEAAGTVRIVVEDDGPGMSSEVRAKCLDSFYTSRAATGGTGLGLSLVRGFVQSVGGALEIQSPPRGRSRGTAFTLSIPASERTHSSGTATRTRAGSQASTPMVQ